MKTMTSIVAILALGAQGALAGTLAPPIVEEDVIIVEEGPAGTGGLGTAGAVAGGLLAIAALAAIIDDDDDDDDEDDTPDTPNGEGEED